MAHYFHEAHAHDADRDVSLLARDQYVREVHWITIMDREEETFLLERVKRGCFERKQPVPNQWRLSLARQARERLVESYQPIILRLARWFARVAWSQSVTDFASEGTIGFLTFLDRLDCYEALTGPTFHALAMSYIRGEMLYALSNRDKPVHVPEKIQQAMKQVEAVEQEWMATHGWEPTAQDIATTMHLSVAKVLELLSYRRRRMVDSLEGLLDDEDDAEERLDFVSLFASAVQTEERGHEQIGEVLRAALATALEQGSRQADVIRVRYGLDEGPCELHSYTAVAAWLGMKEKTVVTHDLRARKKLRRALAVVAGNVGVSPLPPQVA